MDAPVETMDTIIIGAGLSGIYAASLLARRNHPFVILEARDRVGGRIFSPEFHGFFSDLGPSWYWPDIHPKMARLIEVMGLKGFRQFEEGYGRYETSVGRTVRTVGGYAMEPASWRLCGGMMAIVNRLCEHIPERAIRLVHPVCKLERQDDGVLISVGGLESEPWARFRAGNVVLALPPRLAAATILFEPDLPHELTQAMLRIGTWMAGQAKFYALYESPFWRRAGLSGEAFSERGPLCEIHDGSNHGGGPYGLTGFVGIPAVQRCRQDVLIEATLTQLATIYGRSAAQPVAVFYQDWAREQFTSTPYDQPAMVEHPLYQPPAGRTSIWGGAVHFAGTETADQHGGYLEGALMAAERAISDLEAAPHPRPLASRIGHG